MKTVRYGLVVLAVVMITATSATYARVHVSVGIGTHIGGYGPHYGWHSDWYWHHGRGPVYPWYWHPYEPAWVYGCDPIFIGPPVVVERHVVVEQPAPIPPAPQPPSPALSDAEQNKKQELLERLRIADDEERVKATEGLAGFTGDEKVREALEKALLSDRAADVRAAAAKALVNQSGSKAVPALKRAYQEDAERQVSQAADKALIMIQGY
jgi:hypothetical protein